MDGVRICYIGINVNFASIVNERKMQIKYVGGSMKQKTWKALLAIALVLVLTLSLVPLGAAAPGAASAAPDTTDPQAAPEAELRAQTEDVNQTAPAPAEGYIVKLRDARFADGLTCISADDGLYRAADAAQLDALPEAAVDYCEPDYKLSLLDDPAANDTLYTSGAQWNLDNLKVPAAWAKGQFGSGVTVAVLDTGLYGIAGGEHHEDIDPAKVVKPYNARRGEAGAETVTDDHGHGTFVAGMIFANTNNELGIAGVMPNVRLMPIKVLTKANDAAVSDVVRAINYAVENGADVINMSLGSNDFSQALKDACDAAVEKGVIVVAAAGNDGNSTPCYPAAYDSVVGVGSLTKDNLLAASSQYGESVYVTAPGAGVVSTTNAANGYKRSSGTSFAAPEAAALAAMARSIDPSLDQDGFKKLLRDTCTDLGEAGHDSLYGYGMLNFEAAANKLLGTDTDEHHYGAWKSDGGSTHSRTCTDDGCSAKQTELHTWNAGEKQPDGTTNYTCTACAAERISADPISGAWEYQLIKNDTEVMLTKYIGDQSILVVPSSIEVAGKKLPVTALGNKTFLGSKLFWLELPDTITYVEDGRYAYSGVIGACAFCKELTVVKLSAGLEKIADYMFYGSGSNYRLELTVPDGVKEIGLSAFSLCNSILELKLPASVEKIGNSAFYQARRLKTLDLPGVKTIEADAFTETIFEETYENLWKAGEFTGIVYAGNVAYLYFGPYAGASGGREYDPAKMPENTSITLRDGTLGISEFCFASHYADRDSCKRNLKTITVPNSLAYIPDGLFDGYALDMYGFEASYAEHYAKAYGNITFHPIMLPEKPSESYDWYDKAQGGVYELATAGDLWGLADLVETGEDSFAGKTVRLKNDIDLGGVTALGYTIKANEWFPLGIYGKFAGTLDGQGHSIKGLYIDQRSKNEIGLFAALERTACVQNLTVEGVIRGGDYVGGIVGKNANARIENCTFRGEISAGVDYGYAGGIAGYGSGTITGCKTYGALNVRLDYVSDSLLNGASGGIIGYMTLPSTVVSGCENNMTLTSNAMSLGGIAGQSMMRASIQGCTNNGSVNGYRQVGGILGRLVVAGSGGAVTDCANHGAVTAASEDAGGIVGVTSGGDMRITGCKNTGSVQAKLNAAGILGHNSGVIVETSCNTGSIRATSFAGGIIGKDSSNGALNCYNLGSIRADNWAGGISAYLDNAHGVEGRMTNCYNMGEVSSASGKAAPLGSVYQDANVFQNCYYLSAEENTSVENHTGLTKFAFTSGEAAYRLGDAFGQKIGTDLNPVFRTADNRVLFGEGMYYNEGGTPHEHHYVNGVCDICGAPQPEHEHRFGAWTSDGADSHSRTCPDCGERETQPHAWDAGTVTRPATEEADGEMTYTCTVCAEKKIERIPKLERKERSIGTLAELQAFAAESRDNDFQGYTITLTADIDASGVKWEPIGRFVKSSDYTAFAGTFDGCGHTVTICADDAGASGLGFIAANSGTVKNLTVAGSVSGKSYVGGVVGYNLGTITGCTNKADVTAASMTVGGVTAYLKGGAKVAQCANLGAVTGSGTMYTGGIVGQAIAGTFLSESYNAGTVTAAKGYIGGVAGYTMGCATSDCYNVGAVSLQAEKGSVGGITGWFTGTVELTNCYNAGTLTGGQHRGALAGTAAETQVHNSHYLADTAEYAVASKKFTGSQKTADEMRSESFAALLGEAFAPDTHGLNGGYPVLVWQKPAHTHTYTAVVTAPTCTEKGYTTHTCACGDSYVDTYVDALGHKAVIDSAKAATCTETGLTEGKHCETCGKVLVKQEEIPALGHKEVIDPAKAAACTETGLTEGKHCETCGEVLVKQEIIPALGHKEVIDPEKAATCTETGLTEGKHCETCGKVLVEQEEIPMLAHNFADGQCTVCGAKDPNHNPFKDVRENAYYYDAVQWAVRGGITVGTSADTFSPDQGCTRAQIVTFLYRAAGSPKVENVENPFRDVVRTGDGEFYDAILWAVKNGITAGTSADTFSPDMICTRAHIVTFLYNASGATPVQGATAFTDVPQGAWYAEAVAWAAANGITSGTSATTFSPDQTCTRAQAVTFLYNASLLEK